MENNEKKNEEQKNKASVKQFILIIAAAVIIIAVMIMVELGKTDEGEATQQKPTSTQTATDTVQENVEQDQNTESDAQGDKQQDAAEVVKEQTSESETQMKQTEAPKVAPTFMYFITNADKEQAEATVEKLKKEYKDVNFDVRNVDENPEELDSFPIAKGNTPFLIMLNTNNDPCAFEQVSDEARLKEIIESAKN